MSKSIVALIVYLGISLIPLFSQSNAYIDLHKFSASYGNDIMGLVIQDTILYGISKTGGSSNKGAIFSFNIKTNTFINLKDFVGGTDDGAYPFDNLIISGNYLFGSTAIGGNTNNGVLYKIKRDGSDYQVLHHYNSPNSPTGVGGVYFILDSNYIYFTFRGSGINNEYGYLAKVKDDGSAYQLLHTFNQSNDGKYAESLLKIGEYIYGVTLTGGNNNEGTLYKIKKDSTNYSIIKSFVNSSSIGYTPSSIFKIGNSIFGKSRYSDNLEQHTGDLIFKINSDGSSFSIIKSFYDNTITYNFINGFKVNQNVIYTTLNKKIGGNVKQVSLIRVNSDGSNYANLGTWVRDSGQYSFLNGYEFASNSILVSLSSLDSKTNILQKMEIDASNKSNVYNFAENDELQAILYTSKDSVFYGIKHNYETSDNYLFRYSLISNPELDNVSILSITKHSAALNCPIISNGNRKIINAGYCINKTGNPDTNDIVYNFYNNASQSFTSIIGYVNRLDKNTTYYIRAFAYNDIGISYSKQIQITTLNDEFITHYEVFLDEDIGIGSGNLTSTANTDTVRLNNINFSLNSVNTGFHQISIRFKDNLNLWSNNLTRTVMVRAEPNNLLNNPVITKLEYFFDDDPGINNGKVLLFNERSDTLTLTKAMFNTDSLSAGFHQITLRFMDTLNLWSNNLTRTVMVRAEPNNLLNNPVITKLEYFFDDDPGINNGKVLLFNERSDTLTLTKAMFNTDSLSAGFHQITLRFMDTLNLWSNNLTRTFMVREEPNNLLNNPVITKLEYFFDDDPGIDKGKSFLFNERNDTLALTKAMLNTDSLSAGFHQITFRFMDTLNLWSNNLTRTVMVRESSDEVDAKISELEYFIGNDPGFAQGDMFDFLDSTIINQKFILPVHNLPLGPSYATVRFKDDRGVWSHNLSKQVTICEIDGPEASFNYIGFGNEITFIDSSYKTIKWRWDFGDGTIDSTINPRHKYANAGIYNVKQSVNNICGKDSLITQVQISGIQDISPKKGGNIGNVTISIYGVGFADTTIVYLQDSTENGLEKIYPDTLYLSNNVAKANFDLLDKSIGKYDVKVEKLNDPFKKDDILPDIFEIEQGIRPDIELQVIGPPVIRRGVPANYSLNITNKGNIDANNFIVWLMVGPDTNATIKMKFPDDLPGNFEADSTILNDSVPTFYTIDTLRGKPYLAKATAILIPKLAARSTINDLKFSITSTSDSISVAAYNTPPENLLSLGSKVKKDKDKLQDAKKVIQECIFDLVDMDVDPISIILNLIPGYDDIKSCLQTSYEVATDFDNYKEALNGSTIAKAYLIKNLVTLLKDCALSALQIMYPYSTLVRAAIVIIDHMNELVEAFECGWAIGEELNGMKQQPITIRASMDPNEKIGPSNIPGINYVQSSSTLPFTVMFENVDTAALAAQEVFIYDTLDKQHLDLSTFELTSFNFADKTINIPQGLQHYSVDVDMRPAKDLIVRIIGQLDTTAGVAKWHYTSFDPKTMDLTEDPLLGFLAPNQSPPEGEGKVSYLVKPKDSLSNGTVIRNKAKIVFDANQPILTNEWKVTIDDTKPYSTINSLPPVIYDTNFTVSWGGIDPSGSIKGYNIYVKVNDNSYTPWLVGTNDTSGVYKGHYDSTYKFYSIAFDYAGNIEETKEIYDTYITLRQLLPPPLVSPEDSSYHIDIKPTFVWDSSHYSLKYQLQLSDTVNFSNLLIDNQNLIGLSHQYIDSLQYNRRYYWRMRTINGIFKSSWSPIFSFTTIEEPVNIPDSWVFSDSTGVSANILIPKAIMPKVGDRYIAKGDAIGLFFTRNDSLICAGYGVWNSQDLNITVWGDNPVTLIKDGFSSNEVYTFRVWDAQQAKVRKGIVEYESGEHYFNDGLYSVLKKLYTNETQKVIVNQGWNYISSYIIPEKPALEEVLHNNSNSLLILKTIKGKTYIPQYGINTIGDWKTIEAYQGYFTQSDTILINGEVVIPETTPIILNTGWSLISYLRNINGAIEDNLESIVENDGGLLIAKTVNGNVYVPSFGINTIGTMKVGNGYQVYLTRKDSLIYPANSLSKSTSRAISPSPVYLEPKHSITGSSSNLIIVTNANDNDEFGVYNQKDELIGSGIVIHGKSVITIWGDDEQTDIVDGAILNEQLKLKYYNFKTGLLEYNDYQLTNQKGELINNTLRYTKDGILFGRVEVQELNLGLSLDISPNPARESLDILYQLGNANNCLIQIYSSNGEMVDEIAVLNSNKYTYITDKLSSGTYIMVLNCNNQTLMRRFIIVK
ncbi:MAG TPA: PKD domain-containing protein [Candidatus Kapabacteria bacterium]|nr:PKD domain-containing protein [Candidatus Kapabacteria bacterium]